jgi:co-chaperonin GroES (HSP10)
MDDMCLVALEKMYLSVTDIFIPEPSKLFAQKVWKGKVQATGPGYLHEIRKNGKTVGIKRIPMMVKSGDIVIIPAHASNLFKVFDDKTVIIRERDIYAIADNDVEVTAQDMYKQAEERGVLIG